MLQQEHPPPQQVPRRRGLTGTGYPAASTPTLGTAVSQLLGTPEVSLGDWFGD